VLGYYIVKLISKILCHMPQFLIDGTANILGWIAVNVCPSWRMDMAVANIQECLGIDANNAKSIARESLYRFGRMVVEVLRFPILNKSNVDKFVKWEGKDNLQKAFEENKGVVIATGHFGNWELMAAVTAILGYPLLSIVRHQNQGKMNNLINEYREMCGQKIAYNRGENQLLQVVRMLKKGYLIGVLFDQDTNDIGVKLDLFGKSCVFPDGVAALSRMNEAPIVPMFIHNNDDGTSTIRVYPALYCYGKNDYDSVMRELVNIFENEVRSTPEMLFWVHDRWKDGHQRFDKLYDENRHGHHP